MDDLSLLKATVFCIAAISGQLLHAIKKWSEGYAWVLSNPRATVGAVIANLTGMAGFISMGTLDGISALGTVGALGLFMGLSADSVLNKGAQKEWTDEQRAANGAKP